MSLQDSLALSLIRSDYEHGCRCVSRSGSMSLCRSLYHCLTESLSRSDIGSLLRDLYRDEIRGLSRCDLLGLVPGTCRGCLAALCADEPSGSDPAADKRRWASWVRNHICVRLRSSAVPSGSPAASEAGLPNLCMVHSASAFLLLDSALPVSST